MRHILRCALSEWLIFIEKLGDAALAVASLFLELRSGFPRLDQTSQDRPSFGILHFGVSISAITQWRTNGVPVDRMLEVRALSGGAVSLDEMVVHNSRAIPATSKAQAA
jgi:hypothetical protein